MAFGNYYNGVLPAYQNPYYGMPQNQVPIAQIQQVQQNQPQTQTVQPTQQNGGLTWVQGEEGAKAYLVAPNNTVILWDSENPTIYIKSADASGLPSMKILDWTERQSAQKTPLETVSEKSDKYVTRKEFDELKAKIESLNKDESTTAKKATKER